MFLLIFMGFTLFVCFIWSIVLLKRILSMNSDDVISITSTSQRNYSQQTDIIKESQLPQLMPVSSEKWILDRVISQHRVWCCTTQHSTKLYGFTMKIKASAQNLNNFMRKLNKFKEWRPYILHEHSEMISESPSQQTVRWKQRKVKHPLFSGNNIISWWLEPLIEDDVQVNRVFLTGAKYMGIIETVNPLAEATAYICQPIIGLENDQCRLTAITSGDVNRVCEECQCLYDYFMMMRAPTEADQTYTRCDSQNSDPQLVGESGDSETGANNNAAGDDPAAATRDDGSLHTLTNGYISGDSDGEGDEERVDRAEDMNTGNQQTSNSLESSYRHTDPESPSKIRPKLQKSATIPSSQESSSLERSISGSSGGMQRSATVDGSQVVFLRTLSSDNQNGLVDYKTLSNKCAADLLAEVLEASNIVQRPVTKDRSATGDSELIKGWVFESTDRDVAMLQKLDPNNLKLHSWLGKGLIKETPENVWNTLVNPYTRYIHDEMLKDVTVINDLGNGMKLVRLFYSTSQMLRRDNREFYLLQAERIEGKKHILTLCSIEWPEPESKDCPRGKFEASGWIIEPIVSRNQNTYSMVTYLSQIDLGEATATGTQQFEEEFVTKQPLAISDLRNYLTMEATK